MTASVVSEAENERAPLANGRHERFCQELVKGASQTDAYLAAGYRCTKETARRRGSELVTKRDILVRVAALKLAAAERAEVDAAWVLRELKQIAGSSVAEYRVGADGEVEVTGGGPEPIRAVASVKRRVKVDANGRSVVWTELRLWDKVRALELLGKYLGLWETDQSPPAPIQVNVVGPPRDAPRGPRPASWQERLQS
jgi:phage terminase small subunit